MAAVKIDGKAISAEIRQELTEKTARLREKGIIPGLAVILVGDDPASAVYVRNKKRACDEIGYYSEEHILPADTDEKALLDLVKKLNEDSRIHGILVQLPLPRQIDEKKIINAIHPDKDVDAFHPVNVGKIMIGDYRFVPCTPAGVIELLKRSNVEIAGKECVVIGRSNIVGKPMALLLLHENATVTVCHSRTKNIAAVVKRADIVVVAVGRPKFLTGDMLKQGAVVIDVGTSRLDGKLCGDADFDSCAAVASKITPVPGGVGPMTITMLMKNTLSAAEMMEKDV